MVRREILRRRSRDGMKQNGDRSLVFAGVALVEGTRVVSVTEQVRSLSPAPGSRLSRLPALSKGSRMTAKRGFAAMDPEQRRAIARKGGKAAHAHGTAHEFTSDEAQIAGRKGGQILSRDRDHMSKIGRRGGTTISKDRDHMARIGAKGGRRRAENASK